MCVGARKDSSMEVEGSTAVDGSGTLIIMGLTYMGAVYYYGNYMGAV